MEGEGMADDSGAKRIKSALPKGRLGQRNYRRQLKFRAQVLLMENTLAELQKGNATDINALDRSLAGINSGARNELTPHERFLDKMANSDYLGYRGRSIHSSYADLVHRDVSSISIPICITP
jgi:hypothetical protein